MVISIREVYRSDNDFMFVAINVELKKSCSLIAFAELPERKNVTIFRGENTSSDFLKANVTDDVESTWVYEPIIYVELN